MIPIHRFILAIAVVIIGVCVLSSDVNSQTKHPGPTTGTVITYNQKAPSGVSDQWFIGTRSINRTSESFVPVGRCLERTFQLTVYTFDFFTMGFISSKTYETVTMICPPE